MKLRRKMSRTTCAPEYEQSVLTGLLQNGVRGKYVERYRQGTNLVKLAPDVAAAFPTEQSVNEALRRLLASEASLPDKALCRALPPFPQF